MRRGDLAQLQLERPFADAELQLSPGQARLRIEHFALTANNITFTALGESMHYGQFFQAPDGWDCMPVRVFAMVTESRAQGVAAGERVYGKLPMATNLAVQQVRARSDGFSDGAAQRQPLPPIYYRYMRTMLCAPSVSGCCWATAIHASDACWRCDSRSPCNRR